MPSPFSKWSRSRLARGLMTRPRRPVALGVCQLEDRVVPVASVSVAGLLFDAGGKDFLDEGGGVYSLTTPVTVGFDPGATGTYAALLRVKDGMRIRTYEDAKQKPDAEFAVTATTITTADSTRKLLFDGTYAFKSVVELQEKGVGLLPGGQSVQVYGQSFLPNFLQLAKVDGQKLVKLEGLIAFPDFLGLQVPLGKSEADGGTKFEAYVTVDGAGKVGVTGRVESKSVTFKAGGTKVEGVLGLTARVGELGLYGTLKATFGYAKTDAVATGPQATDEPKNLFFIQVGSEASPGLVVRSELGAKFTGEMGGTYNFGGGISLEVPENKPASVSYDTGNGKWSFSGTVKLNTPKTKPGSDARVFNGADATVSGSFAKGQLEKLALKVNAKLNLFGLEVAAKDVAVEYARATGVLAVSGELEVDFFKTVKISAGIPVGGLFINMDTGEVKLSGLELAMAHDKAVSLGAFGVNDLKFSYDEPTPGDVRVSVTLDVTMPGGYEIGGQVRLVSVGDYVIPDTIRLNYESGRSGGIAVGSTGLFLTHAAVAVENISQPAEIRVTGSMAMTLGKRVKILGTDAELLAARGEVVIDRHHISLEGSITMANGRLAEGSGRLDVNWSTGVYRVDADLNFFQGTFRANAQVLLDPTSFRALLTGSFSVPDFVPVLGGTRVGGAGIYVSIERDGVDSQRYVAGWIEVNALFTRFTVGAKYSFDGNWSRVSAQDVAGFRNSFEGTADERRYTTAVTVEAGRATTALTVGARWSVPVTAGRVKVTLPGGKVVEPNAGDPTVQLVTGGQTGRNILITSGDANRPLPPGQYLVTVTSDRALGPNGNSGDVTFNVATVSTPPQATLGSVAANPNGSLDVGYTATTVSDAALRPVVELYMVSAFAPQSGGRRVASVSIPAGRTLGTIRWADFAAQPAGDYFVYALVKDGVNPPVRTDLSAGGVRPQAQASGRVSRQAGGALPTNLSGWVVFLDADGDGRFSPGTPSGDGTPAVPGDPLVYTGADGRYAFTGVPAGTYKLGVTLPAGYANGDGPDLGQSEDSLLGYTVTVGGGAAARGDLDFALRQAATVEGLVFNDLNGNGRRDAGEGGAAGVRVYLDANGDGARQPDEPEAVTNDAGEYAFLKLDPGAYTVRVKVPEFGRATTTASGGVTVSGPDELVTGPLVGLLLPVTLSGRAFVEVGGGAGYSAGLDRPLPGVTFTLSDARGETVSGGGGALTATADADGLYSFGPLPPDTYRVRESAPAGYRAVSGAVEPGSFGAQRQLHNAGLPPIPAYNRYGYYGYIYASADLNRDGIPDLVATSSVTQRMANGTVYWPVYTLLGVGDGTFRPAVQVAISAPNGAPSVNEQYDLRLDLADFNRDGLIDILLTSAYSATISRDRLDVGLTDFAVLFNTGSDFADGRATTFVQTLLQQDFDPYSDSKGGRDLRVGDFNGDGWPDLAVVEHGRQPTVLLNRFAGDAGRAPTTPFQTAAVAAPAGVTWSRMPGLVYGDFFGAGRNDLAVLARSSADSVGLYGLANEGDGRFTARSLLPLPNLDYSALATADFDGNGLPDIAAIDGATGKLVVGLNLADATFRSADLSSAFATYAFPALANPDAYYQSAPVGSVTVADVNGDGHPDLVVAGLTADGGRQVVLAFLNDGAGRFGDPVRLAIDTNSDKPDRDTLAHRSGDLRPVFTDLNGDGLPDLVLPAGVSKAEAVGYVYLNGAARGTSQAFALASGGAARADFGHYHSGAISGSFPALAFGDTERVRRGKGLSVEVRRGEAIDGGHLRVFLDANGNGQWDAGEAVTAATRDPASGRFDFRFDNLPDGAYTVRAFLTGAAASRLAALRSGRPQGSLNVSFGPLVATVAGGAGAAALDLGGVGGVAYGMAFNDRNRNGVQDANEGGVAGATVYDDRNRNGAQDAGEPTLGTTDENGAFAVASPLDARWTLAVAPPAGYSAGGAPRAVVAVSGGAGFGPLGIALTANAVPVTAALAAGVSPLVGFAGEFAAVAGDTNGDGVPDVVVGAGPGGGPRVQVFDGSTGLLLHDFFAFEEGFRGGVVVAEADLNGDGVDDLVVGAGAGGGPRVRVFDGRTLAVLFDFFAFEPGFAGGVSVAAGDVNGDGTADLVVGAGAGGGPHVRVIDGRTLTDAGGALIFDDGFRGGVRVTAADLDGDGVDEVLVTSADGSRKSRVYEPLTRTHREPPPADELLGVLIDAHAGPNQSRPWAAYSGNAAGRQLIRFRHADELSLDAEPGK